MIVDQGVPTGTITLARIRRGVKDAERAAEFYGWLLGLVPETVGDGFRLPGANGELIIHPDSSTPVAIELDAGNAHFRGHDLDGVPVAVSNHDVEAGTGAVKLDHIAMNCTNLAEAIAFYRKLGFVLTWCGSPPDYENQLSGFHEHPMPGADWVHVSCADGYLSLGQADWQEYGSHNANAGPPRLIHVGFTLPDVSSIAAQLDEAGIPYLRAPRDSLGDRLYLNDPDGIDRLGNNVELIQYRPDVSRSGKPPY